MQRLGIDGALARTLKTTNPIENMNGAVAHHTRNVRRWRDGQMLLRRAAAALHEAQRGFRRIRGHRDLRKLCGARRNATDAAPTTRRWSSCHRADTPDRRIDGIHPKGLSTSFRHQPPPTRITNATTLLGVIRGAPVSKFS